MINFLIMNKRKRMKEIKSAPADREIRMRTLHNWSVLQVCIYERSRKNIDNNNLTACIRCRDGNRITPISSIRTKSPTLDFIENSLASSVGLLLSDDENLLSI